MRGPEGAVRGWGGSIRGQGAPQGAVGSCGAGEALRGPRSKEMVSWGRGCEGRAVMTGPAR